MAHFRKKNYLFLFFILAISCQNKTDFFVLENISDHLDKSILEKEITEHIIVSNPPERLDSLVNLIRKYNESTVNYCGLIKNEKLQYYRKFFYRESWRLNRYYEEEEGFISDHIGHYSQEIIAVLEYNHKKKWQFQVRLSDSDKWEYYSVKEAKCD